MEGLGAQQNPVGARPSANEFQDDHDTDNDGINSETDASLRRKQKLQKEKELRLLKARRLAVRKLELEVIKRILHNEELLLQSSATSCRRGKFVGNSGAASSSDIRDLSNLMIAAIFRGLTKVDVDAQGQPQPRRRN